LVCVMAPVVVIRKKDVGVVLGFWRTVARFARTVALVPVHAGRFVIFIGLRKQTGVAWLQGRCWFAFAMPLSGAHTYLVTLQTPAFAQTAVPFGSERTSFLTTAVVLPYRRTCRPERAAHYFITRGFVLTCGVSGIAGRKAFALTFGVTAVAFGSWSG